MAKPNLGEKVYQREQHGMRGTLIYGMYTAMLSRCRNPNNKSYHRYGGRGIKVCDRWERSFLAFYEDMGDCPEGCQIDRINNNGHYEPGNCRWTTSKLNNRNRRDSVHLEHNGERLHIQEWVDRTGINRQTIQWRLKQGMSVEEALTTPLEDLNLYVDFHGERVTMAEVERRTGIDRGTIAMRMKRKGMTLEQAAAVPLLRKPVWLTYKGEEYRLFELAKLVGMPAVLLKHRIDVQGMTVEQAIETPRKR